jgi:hypothetical protein
MSEKYKHKDGERIYFELDDKIKGFGIVCGTATDELPVLGRSWMVKVEEPLPYDLKIYPFSCISVFEVQIKEPPKNEKTV